LSRLPISLLGLKTGTLFSGASTLNATFWISANATLYPLRKTRQSRTARRDLPGHRSNDFIEYNVYGFFHYAVGEMKELTCYVEVS
jgi:hypothetical protein